MLIARTPVRISFGGGGTNLEDYSAKYGGLVIITVRSYAQTLVLAGEVQ